MLHAEVDAVPVPADNKILCPFCGTIADEEMHMDVRTSFIMWTHYGLRCSPYVISCRECSKLYYVTNVAIEHHYTVAKR